MGTGRGMETDNVEATRGDVPSPLRQRRSEAGKRHFTAARTAAEAERLGVNTWARSTVKDLNGDQIATHG